MRTLKDHTVTLIKNAGQPFRANSLGRNDPCRCGSGKKAKKCCGNDTKYFTPKPSQLNAENLNETINNTMK